MQTLFVVAAGAAGLLQWLENHGTGVAVAMGLVLVGLSVARRLKTRGEPAYLMQVRALAAEGRYREAGDLQLRHGALTHAFNIFVRGEIWDRASSCAERMGNTKRAAEYAEKAKAFDRAAKLYEGCERWGAAARSFRAAGLLEDVARICDLDPECSAVERAAAWEAAYHDARAREDVDPECLARIAAAAGRSFIKAGNDEKAEYFGASGGAIMDARTRTVAHPPPIPPDESASALPSHDGRYSLEGKLGAGGMGVVHRAHDRVLDRFVALKLLPETLTADEVARKLFEREARAAAALSHPNIVVVYDFGLIDGRPFLSMELIEGGSLAQALEEHEGGLPLSLLDTVARDLLAAVDFAHSSKTVHRDIKPGNLLLTAQDQVKLTDFGIAKLLDTGPKGTTIVAGTPAYMAPEQLAGKGVDHRADLFAVGVTLYELATGRKPFVGAARDRPATPASNHRPELPRSLCELVEHCLALDPEARPQTAKEAITELGRAPTGENNVIPFRRARPRLEYSMSRGEVSPDEVDMSSSEAHMYREPTFESLA